MKKYYIIRYVRSGRMDTSITHVTEELAKRLAQLTQAVSLFECIPMTPGLGRFVYLQDMEMPYVR